MSLQFEKEAILEGLLDSYCLVCEDHLRDKNEVITHIAKPVHSKNLKAAQSVKTPYDQILKVKHGYFCIPCGLFLSTVAKTSLHVKEKQHYRKRAVQNIERVGGYVSVDNLLIDYKAWCGLMENSCAVCNLEVPCENLHKSQSSHIMNLIHSNVELDHEKIYRKVDESSFHCITCNELYSLHDISTHFEDSEHKKRWSRCRFECVKHHVQQTMIKLSSSCRQFKQVTINHDLQHEKYSDTNHSSSSEGFNSDCPSEDFVDAVDLQENDDFIVQRTILDSVVSFEKSEVNINFENETAFCKKCFVHINFDHNTILSHIRDHDRTVIRRNCSYVPFPCEVNMRCKAQTSSEPEISLLPIDTAANANVGANSNPINEKKIKTEQTKNPVQSDAKKYCDEDRAAFANTNHLEYEKNNGKVYCRICKVMLPNSIASMIEHVAGNVHKKLATTYVAPPNTSHTPATPNARINVKKAKENTTFYRKSSMEDFISELITVTTFAGDEIVVNGKYCIDELSFLMVTGTGLSLRCQACEENLNSDQVKLHEGTWYHRQAMNSTPIVTSSVDKTEFVREVRPGIFHCGYCNMVIAPWADLQNHLKSNEHKTVKVHYEYRLHRHMPGLSWVRLRHQLERGRRAQPRFGSSRFGF